MKNLLPESVTSDIAFREQSRKIITENFGITDLAEIDIFENIASGPITFLANGPIDRNRALKFLDILEENYVKAFNGSFVDEEANETGFSLDDLKFHFNLNDTETAVVGKITRAIAHATVEAVQEGVISVKEMITIAQHAHHTLHEAFGGHDDVAEGSTSVH